MDTVTQTTEEQKLDIRLYSLMSLILNGDRIFWDMDAVDDVYSDVVEDVA